jgi:hypothetical protein
MPILSASVNDRWHQARGCLGPGLPPATARPSPTPKSHRRTASRSDLETKDQGRPTVRAINLATGELVHISQQDNQAFWQWAAIETLRLAGCAPRNWSS